MKDFAALQGVKDFLASICSPLLTGSLVALVSRMIPQKGTPDVEALSEHDHLINVAKTIRSLKTSR